MYIKRISNHIVLDIASSIFLFLRLSMDLWLEESQDQITSWNQDAWRNGWNKRTPTKKKHTHRRNTIYIYSIWFSCHVKTGWKEQIVYAAFTNPQNTGLKFMSVTDELSKLLRCHDMTMPLRSERPWVILKTLHRLSWWHCFSLVVHWVVMVKFPKHALLPKVRKHTAEAADHKVTLDQIKQQSQSKPEYLFSLTLFLLFVRLLDSLGLG